jgi:aspartate aminotransferase
MQEIHESQTLALTVKAKRMQEAGIDVVSLTVGEPDFPTPRHVKEAAIKAIESNFTRYTANQGTAELINAIIQKFSTENSLQFEPDQILVSTGAKQSIHHALQAICNKGDEVVILSPHWVSYPEIVKLVDAVPRFVQRSIRDDFRPDVRKLRRAINQKTKAIILNSPCNPTGVVYTQSELEDIAAIARDAGVFIISDEIYEKVMYEGHKHFSVGSIKSIRDQVITVNGVSKAYAMTGWRIGYMGGPRSVIEAAAKVQGQITNNANSIAQKATIAALNGSTNDLDMMVNEFKLRRDFAYETLSALRDVEVNKPAGAFYFFFSVAKLYGRKFNGARILNSADMARYLLERHNVALVPGFAFGDDSCVRMSYACGMADLEKGLQRIKLGLESLE